MPVQSDMSERSSGSNQMMTCEVQVTLGGASLHVISNYRGSVRLSHVIDKTLV